MRRLFSKVSEHLGSTDVVAAWRGSSDLLAVAGHKRRVTIYDRGGVALADINLPDPDVDYDDAHLNSVVALEWHASGTYLAVLPRGQHFCMVWSADTHEVARVDADIKGAEACFLLWCPSEPRLLLGSARGSAVVYDCAVRAIAPLQTKLGKAVCSGVWVEGGGAAGAGLLLLGSKDQGLGWFDPDTGALLRLTPLRGVAAQLLAYTPPDATYALVSAALGRRWLLVWQLPLAALHAAPPPPLELSFQDRYGELEAHIWLEGALVLAGFRSGQVAVVAVRGGRISGDSSRAPRPGTELYSSRLLPYPVGSLSYCAACGSVAVAGGAAVGVVQWETEGGGRAAESDWAELDGGQQVAQAAWSPDGQLLTVTTKNGKLHQYLVKAPTIHAVDGTRVATTTSLTDVTVVDLKAKKLPAAVRLRMLQPQALALGPAHLAAIGGTQVAFHSLAPGEDGLLPPPHVLDYPARIKDCHINAHCAVLLGEEGRVFVQQPPASEDGVVELRGDDGQPYQAARVSLTQQSIIVGLPDGTLAFYDCPSLEPTIQYHHTGGGIASISPHPSGDKLVISDDSGGVYLYIPADDDLIQPAGFEGQLSGVVWHADDPNLLALVSGAGDVHCYVFIPSSVEGRGLKFLGKQATSHGAVPLVLQQDCLTCRLPAGTHEDLCLDAFAVLAQDTAAPPDGSPAADWRERCQQALAICHLGEAVKCAQNSGDAAVLREVALAALHLLDVPTAVVAYRAAGDEDAAVEVEQLCDLDDPNLLAGRVLAVLGGDLQRAEELLLASSRPVAAVELRKELGQWEEAYRLAREVDPSQAGPICMAKAQACEADGHFEEAAFSYRESLGHAAIAEDAEAAFACQAGLARCSVQAGDYDAGSQLALQLGDTGLCKQCGQLLEAAQRSKGAADLYAAAGLYDRAAELYLSCREFGLVGSIMPRTSSSGVRLQYAQAKEDLGSFGESAAAYLEAGQPLQAVRVYLQRLGDVQAALRAAEGSAEGALMVAEHCLATRQFGLAVETYCLAGCWDDGFSLAQKHGKVEAFCDQVRAKKLVQQALRLADYFEGRGDLVQAAEFAALGGQYERAARIYLQAGDDSVQQAITLAAAAKDCAAVAVVVQHLEAAEGMADRLIELHLAVGQPAQACAVAVTRARAEQTSGNYKVARDQLLRMCAALQEWRAAATPELLQALATLHSYLLVKTLVRLGDHLGAARMLLRVAGSIDTFPKHAVPILTSTVIECHRAELHASAHKWANVLMRPEHVGLVAEPYRKKIEGIARLPSWDADEAKPAPCECLFCGVAGPETELACSSCRAAIPFCLATGCRVSLSDYSECPSCHFPCRGTALSNAVSRDRMCPLCEREVAVHSVRKIFDPLSHLRRTVYAGLLSKQ